MRKSALVFVEVKFNKGNGDKFVNLADKSGKSAVKTIIPADKVGIYADKVEILFT